MIRYFIQRHWLAWKIIRTITKMVERGIFHSKVETKYLVVELYYTELYLIVESMVMNSRYTDKYFGMTALTAIELQARRFELEAVIVRTNGNLKLQTALIDRKYTPHKDDPSAYVLKVGRYS